MRAMGKGSAVKVASASEGKGVQVKNLEECLYQGRLKRREPYRKDGEAVARREMHSVSLDSRYSNETMVTCS